MSFFDQGLFNHVKSFCTLSFFSSSISLFPYPFSFSFSFFFLALLDLSARYFFRIRVFGVKNKSNINRKISNIMFIKIYAKHISNIEINIKIKLKSLCILNLPHETMILETKVFFLFGPPA